ncbi:MAG: DUF4229 domain-containing protein [Beijerinckiaceae bacterium]
MSAWLRFTLLRLALFAGVLAVLMLIGLDWFWAALIAAVVGFCISFNFFREPREAAVAELTARRGQRARPTSDEAAEDDPRA